MRDDIIPEPVVSRTSASEAAGKINSSLPDEVWLFAWVRAIRWIGWGLGKPLLPVFIMAFSQTFAEAGLFNSTLRIVSLASLPIIGIWVDRTPAKRLVLWSLLLYPLVGLGYLLAGMFRMAVFMVSARALQGFTWELENVGMATYYRRVIERAKIATSFGFLDTWSNLAWILAAMIGMYLVSFMPIYYLLSAVAPFSIVAYVIALKAPKDTIRSESGVNPPFMSALGQTMNQWRQWTARFWLLGALIFFRSIINCLMTFYIPITAYLAGTNLPMVVLLGVLGATPALFGYKLGSIADGRNRYGMIALGLICVAGTSIWLAAVHTYWLKLCAVFVIGIIVELFYVVQSSLITTLGPAETYGKRGSAFESISTLGDLVAPLLLGVIFDLIGFSDVSLVIGAVAIAFALLFHFRKSDV